MSRLFLAIPVRLYNYEQVKKDFGTIVQGRWREEQHLHVTVAFLGKHFKPDALLEKLSLFDWSFDISELSKFDYFIKSRVFVATSQNPTLQQLYERLETVLGLEEADICPHATLMRVKKIIDSDAFFNLLKTAPAAPIGILESKVVLYKSVLRCDGAVYKVLHEWPLTV